jgi:hypothetical protein
MQPATSVGIRAAHRIAAFAIGLALLAPGFVAPEGAAAQETAGWVAIQVYACPSWMTAESLDPWSCALVTEGVDVQLWTLDGVPLRGFGDAYFDGWTWTWAWLPVGPPGEAYPYQVVQTVPPPGSWGSVVLHAPADGDGSMVWLSADAPGADLHIYNFVS